MFKFKVSQRELKLSIILLSLVIMGLTYQFVYIRNLDKADTINSEIKNLNIQLSDKESKLSNKSNLTADSKAINQKIKGIINSYGDGASEEKSMMFVEGLENEADMTVNSISFNKPEYFLSASDTGSDSNNADSNHSTDCIDIKSLSGYKSSIQISFKVSYEGLKKCLNYINEYPEKSTVTTMTVSFDSETGSLYGSMNILTYHLQGGSRKYTDPVIPYVSIGTDNIFDTIELPVK